MSSPPSPAAVAPVHPALARPAMTLLILWLLSFTAFGQMVAVAPLVTEIAQALSVAESQVGLIVTAHGVLLGLITLAAGPLSDKVGRRRILTVSVAVLAASLLAHAAADRLATLAALRALSGAAAGVTMAAAVAYIGDVFPAVRRGWATGWAMSGFAAAQVLVAPMAAVLGHELGFRAPFLILGGVALMAWALVMLRLAPTGMRRAERVRLAAALADYGRFLSRRQTAAACAVTFSMLFGVSCFITYFPEWMERAVGLSSVQIGLVLAAGGVGNLIAGPTAGWLSDRIGRPVLVACGSLWAGGVMAGFAWMEALGLAGVIAAFVALMMGVATRGSVMQTLVTELTADQLRGRFVSLTLSSGHLGFGLGAAVAGLLHDQGGFAAASRAAALSGVAIAVLVAVFLRHAGGRRQGRHPHDQAVTAAPPGAGPPSAGPPLPG